MEPLVETVKSAVLLEENANWAMTVVPFLSVAVGESGKTSPLFRETVLRGTEMAATTLPLGVPPPQEGRLRMNPIRTGKTKKDEYRRMYPPRTETFPLRG
jgi:hypothetical protein